MTGVLFEGGSFRPVFSCGIMDALLEEGIMFPYCIGVSAGAADAASYISRQPERNIRILEKYRNDKRYLSKRNFLKERSIFGLDFVFREIPNKLDVFDMKTFKEYDGRFVIVTTDAKTGKVHYFDQKDVDETFEVFCATCALPGACPPAKINGRKYYDGGLSDPIPIDKCLEDGCDKMLIVLTQPEGFIKTPRKSEKNMAKIMKLKYPAIAEELLKRCDKYNESVRLCEKLEKAGKAVILRPKYKLNSLESDTGKLRQTYEMGKEIAKENMDKIKFLCEK